MLGGLSTVQELVSSQLHKGLPSLYRLLHCKPLTRLPIVTEYGQGKLCPFNTAVMGMGVLGFRVSHTTGPHVVTSIGKH